MICINCYFPQANTKLNTTTAEMQTNAKKNYKQRIKNYKFKCVMKGLDFKSK